MMRPLVITTLLLTSIGEAAAANFGTVIPVRGHLSDIALDNRRGVLYAANFTANRIEVLSLAGQSLQAPINVAPQPSAVAVSPDGHFLVVGHYADPKAPEPALTVVNLDSGTQQAISLGGESVLAAAFGNGNQTLIVTTKGVKLVDPTSGALTTLTLTDLTSTPLPVPWATFPAQIISGSANVSGDGNVIYTLVDEGAQSVFIRYTVSDGSLVLGGATSSPILGPRVVSVDQTGRNFLAGWALFGPGNNGLANLAQFPYPPGILNQGSHAFDAARNLIYAQVAPGAIQLSPGTNAAGPMLQIFDADNLTVRETFHLRENLAGKSLLSGDSMYSISDSGLTVFPIAALSKVHRLKGLQEDLLFQSNGCNQGVLTQYIDIVDPGGNATDFTLTSASPGITFSATSGITPARVQVFVDPVIFQDQKGTAAVSVQLTSSSAVNFPAPVRILINTRNPDQRGAIYNAPGTIVDVVADPARDRFYLLRQDQNQVIVFDGSSMNQIATLRTGNTPVQMAVYGNYLLVTNDNSQYISVFDLSTLLPSAPVFLPSGFYAHSIAAANGSILATTRSASGGPPVVLTVDFPSRIANAANTWIYTNQIDPNSVVGASPSGQSIFMAMPDGTVALYDSASRLFVASRKDVSGGLGGAYAALADGLYLAGNYIFNDSLVPQGQLDLLGGLPSGIAIVDGKGVLSTVPAGGRNGVIQRFSLDTLSPVSPARTAEAPDLVQTITRTPLGQTGQTILPFTRTLAPLTNRQYLIQLSTSGFTAIPWVFDAPTQPPVIASITNAADLSSAVAPGGLITVWGSGFSDSTAAATSLPLANGLNNACLYANGVPAPMLFVSPNQINAQLPFNVAQGASLVLANANGTSTPFNFTAQATAPAIFQTGSGTPIIIRTVDGKMITDSTPIHQNEKLIIYLTGLGSVTPGVTAGVAAPTDPLASTTLTPRVYIGGTQLFTLWSGLAPGFVGLYQVNVQVPFNNVPTGSKVPFTIIQGDVQTQIKVPVQP